MQAEWKKLDAQTVAQLKELCALHGLRKTGVKAELVTRLLVALAARQQVFVTAIVNGVPEHENFVVSRWPLTIGRQQMPGAGQCLQLSNDKTISREHIRVTVDATGQAESGLMRLYRLRSRG